ncbi:Inositol-pentakisphosphate 2-kinase [Cytospora mali]|uniref:Inositol-pentakisphosphate 2-kinase n=1 Tax=Cytospora mali TaxID=578113 RepID=A0A194VA42_CYTMA|nr:Inositol-pentakisphosphate 2-kinase [Valsa mali var. pyri (nom. inval.)]
METVPESATVNFVGEGRANVVFELLGVENHTGLRGQLLRLPKDKSKAMSYVELQNYWEKKVSPLFEPHELVQQRLVKLPKSPAFFARLNQQLRGIEEKSTRRRDFVGHSVSEAVQIGMLVEDMRPGASQGGETSLHEIKPKWLHQSPRAPKGAEQCRNCAREVQRQIKDKSRHVIFCPLNLVKVADFPKNQDVAGDIRRSFGLSEAESNNLQAWLRSSSLLQRLRAAQWDNDHEPAIADAERYCLAMTLRDCSLFLKISRRPGSGPDGVVAKLADMDMKNFEIKKDYWERRENDLHERGLYWKADTMSKTLTDCQLPFYKASRKMPAELQKYYPG